MGWGGVGGDTGGTLTGSEGEGWWGVRDALSVGRRLSLQHPHEEQRGPSCRRGGGQRWCWGCGPQPGGSPSTAAHQPEDH